MHFAAEERHMQSTQYPEYNVHKLQHDKFVKRLETILERKRSGEQVLSTETISTLKEWVVTHVQTVDKKYGPYLSDKGIK